MRILLLTLLFSFPVLSAVSTADRSNIEKTFKGYLAADYNVLSPKMQRSITKEKLQRVMKKSEAMTIQDIQQGDMNKDTFIVKIKDSDVLFILKKINNDFKIDGTIEDSH